MVGTVGILLKLRASCPYFRRQDAARLAIQTLGGPKMACDWNWRLLNQNGRAKIYEIAPGDPWARDSSLDVERHRELKYPALELPNLNFNPFVQPRIARTNLARNPMWPHPLAAFGGMVSTL